MPMKLMTVLLVCGMIAIIPACKSNSADHKSSAAVPCTCGTPEAQMEGCANPVCLSGKSNPDNPQCVCGTMTIAPANKK